MIKFSFKNQSFYDMDLSYSDLPNDLIEITAEQHHELLNALNSGCIIFADLTYSAPKPSQFHQWNGTVWVDNRTEQEIAEYNRSLLQPITKLQFAKVLRPLQSETYDNLWLQAKALIDADEDASLEFELSRTLHRNNELLNNIAVALGFTPEQVDVLWAQALIL